MSYLCHLICVFVSMCVRGKGAGGVGEAVAAVAPPDREPSLFLSTRSLPAVRPSAW